MPERLDIGHLIHLVNTDPAVLSATIQALGAILATLIAALATALIGHKWANQKRLKEKLSLAIADMAFMLEVEKEHCRLHKEATGVARKNQVRKVASEKGLFWSGEFTPGRVQHKIAEKRL